MVLGHMTLLQSARAKPDRGNGRHANRGRPDRKTLGIDRLSHRVHVAACVAVVLAAAPGAAQAQTAVGEVLDRIVAEALVANPGLGQERWLEAKAAAGEREARGRYLPSLSFEGRYSEQAGTLDLGDIVNPSNAALNQLLGESRLPTDLNLTLPFRHESRLRLVQPVYDERIRAGHAAARHAGNGQREQRRVAARRLAAEAQTAFLQVAAARAARRIWDATVPLVAEGERVAQRLVDAGTSTPDAVYRARAERSDVEQRLIEAREQESTAARAFNRLLARPLDTPVEALADSVLCPKDVLPDEASAGTARSPAFARARLQSAGSMGDADSRIQALAEPRQQPVRDAPSCFELGLTEEAAVASALERREELAQVRAGLSAARAGVRVATASYLPAIAVAMDYGFQGPDVSFRRDDDFAVATVVLSWSAFNGGQDRARRQAAQADVERLRARLAETEDLVRLDVLQAYEAAVVASSAIMAADARLAAARRSFELVRRRWEEGLASAIEFLDARTTLTNAELNRSVTIFRSAIHHVELERAAALRDLEEQE